ncbi:MAG: hypothetical protein QOI61_1641 [Actinomycetota bacterium]
MSRRLALLIALLLGVASCGDNSRQDVTIQDGRLTDSTTIALTLNICHAEDRNVTVSERDDAVTVEVSAKAQRGGHDDCAEGVTVSLAKPLGDRPLVDRATGDAIDLSGP